MTLSPGAKVQPKRSTLRSLAGLSAACSSMFSERAPTPPRFIGQSTWMSRMGSRPNRLGIRVFTSSMMRATAASGSSAWTRRLDDVDHLLAEGAHELLGIDWADAPDHAGREVLLDAVG